MAAPPTGASTKDTDQLHQLGYAQELRRGMKTFSNFAVSFTIISILSGCLTLFLFAMNTGGPAIMTLGWLVVGFFVTLVALGMAEVASSYPTAGGLYYWAAKLAPESGRDPAKWSWFVGWFNLVGQVAVTAGIDFGLATFATALLNLDDRLPGHARRARSPCTPSSSVLHALLNTFGIRLVALLNDVSGVVARRRRRRHRRRVRAAQPAHPHRPRAPCSSKTRQQHRVRLGRSELRLRDPRHPAVRRADRAPERPVHADRLRRVGAHVRGDPRRRARRAARHRVLGRRVGDLRVHPARRDERRDHAGEGLPGRRRHDGRRLHPRADVADRRAAGADLDRRHRPVGRHLRAVPRRRRPVLLRHVVGHRELADDLRVLARRRDPRQLVLAPHQQAHPDADQLDLARRRRRVHPRACPTCTARSPTSRSPRSRSSACTSPTSRPCSCA